MPWVTQESISSTRVIHIVNCGRYQRRHDVKIRKQITTAIGSKEKGRRLNIFLIRFKFGLQKYVDWGLDNQINVVSVDDFNKHFEYLWISSSDSNIWYYTSKVAHREKHMRMLISKQPDVWAFPWSFEAGIRMRFFKYIRLLAWSQMFLWQESISVYSGVEFYHSQFIECS